MSKPDRHLVSMCEKCPGKTCFPILKSTDPMPPVDEAPPFCPMRRFPQLMKQVESEYERPEIREFARLASVQEAECYEMTQQGIRTKIPRLEETIQFAQKCNYKRIGIAFCVGLKEEASMVAEILAAKGMEVVSVNCKVAEVPRVFFTTASIALLIALQMNVVASGFALITEHTGYLSRRQKNGTPVLSVKQAVIFKSRATRSRIISHSSFVFRSIGVICLPLCFSRDIHRTSE